MAQQNSGLVARIGPVQVDIPRTLGYFGGAAAAVAFGVVEAPLGLVIAAAPFARLLNSPRAQQPTRFMGQLLEGAVAPIGGEDDGIISVSSGGSGGERASGRSRARRSSTKVSRGRAGAKRAARPRRSTRSQ